MLVLSMPWPPRYWVPRSRPPFHLRRPNEFTAANALLQTTTSIGIIIGPALSGVGIATMSSQEVLCVNAVSYVVSAICFLFIRFPWSNRS